MRLGSHLFKLDALAVFGVEIRSTEDIREQEDAEEADHLRRYRAALDLSER